VQISQIIKQKRKELDLTQDALAEKLGITPQAVSKWENGVSMPDITILNNLSLALGCTIDELINGINEKTENQPRKEWGMITGIITKDIHGDVGKIVGDVNADIYGNVKGDIVGKVNNIFGNVEGSIFGIVRGNITGYVSGKLRGIVEGSVKLGVRGKVLGSIVADGINVDTEEEKIKKKIMKSVENKKVPFWKNKDGTT